MNISPSAVLVILVVAAVINLFVYLAWTTRARADRSRRLAEVGGYMSSSFDDGLAQRAASDWPAAGWPASDAVTALRARSAEPVETAVEPFAYPAPNPLEQRSVVDEVTEDGDGWVDDEAEDEDLEVAADKVEDKVDDKVDDKIDDNDMMEGAEIVATDEDPIEPDDAVEALDVESAAVELVAEPAEAPQTIGEIAASRGMTAPRGRDPLTGLLDGMAFQDVLSNEEAREQRYGRPATVIVFELDGLGKLVDRLGPEVGDRIETALGDSIRRLARRADHVARLERGRYAVLLPETDEVAAINYVERIRRACDLWLESGAIAMRLSIGWASTGGDTGLTGAVRIATERMRLELRRSVRQPGDELGDGGVVDGQPAEAGAA